MALVSMYIFSLRSDFLYARPIAFLNSFATITSYRIHLTANTM